MYSVRKVVVCKPRSKVPKMLKSVNQIKRRPLGESNHCIKASSRSSMTTTQSSPPVEQLTSSPPTLLETESTPLAGRLELIIGPMFSGKTTELMKRVDVEESSGLRVLAIKSELDTRYAKIEDHKSFLVTHSGGKRDCLAVAKLAMIEKLYPEEYRSAEVIAIDEAQFFTDLESFCRRAVDRDCKVVYVAGLDGDFRRKPFKMDSKRSSQILQLVPLADNVSKQHARCHYCRRPAPFTLRTTPEKSEVLVGGADSYVPVCRAHYLLKWKEFHSDST